MTTPAWFRRAAPLALALLGAGAAAQTGPYHVGASQSIVRETNLLRLADDQAAPLGYSKSDTVSVTSVFAGIDQPISRQRVFADATLRAARYADNEVYDHEGYALRAGVDWETVNRLSGSIRAATDRRLASFNTAEVGLLTRRNLETMKNFDADVRLGGVTRYTFEAGAGWRELDNSLDDPRVQSRNYEQTRASLGVRYWPSGATWFGLSLRGARGDYTFDRYTRTDVQASARVQPSDVSAFDGQLRWGRTDYDINDRRDFSGVTGNAGWVWRPTGKLRVDTRVFRDTGHSAYTVVVDETDATADYSRVTTALRVRADHAYSAKIVFNAMAYVARRDLVRTIDDPLVPLAASGRENVVRVSVGGRWAPTRSVAVGCSVGTERVSSSGQLGIDLRAHRASCYGQFTID